MPSSINGFGTGLIAASKKRTNDGDTQFDAIEAFMVAFLPIIPYKVLHVLSMQHKGYSEQYQFVPLRFSGRVVLLAYLNRWGIILGGFGGILLAIGGFTFQTMARPMTAADKGFLFGTVIATLAGIALWVAYFVISRSDEKVKDLIGPHRYGTSDPIHWPDAAAEAMIFEVQQAGLGPTITDAARRALAEGQTAAAMLYVRLGMRDKSNLEAADLCRRLLQS